YRRSPQSRQPACRAEDRATTSQTVNARRGISRHAAIALAVPALLGPWVGVRRAGAQDSTVTVRGVVQVMQDAGGRPTNALLNLERPLSPGGSAPARVST